MKTNDNSAQKLFPGILAVGLLLTVGLFTGCSTTDEPQNTVPVSARRTDLAMPASGKSKVVFLRPGHMAWAVHFGVHDGDRLIGKSSSSSYFAYECDPGHHVFSTSMENLAFLDADLLPDRIYYVRVKAEMGAWIAEVKMFPLYPGCDAINWRELPKILGGLEREQVSDEDVEHDAKGKVGYMERLKKYQDDAKPGKPKILPEYGQPTAL